MVLSFTLLSQTIDLLRKRFKVAFAIKVEARTSKNNLGHVPPAETEERYFMAICKRGLFRHFAEELVIHFLNSLSSRSFTLYNAGFRDFDFVHNPNETFVLVESN